MSLLARESTAGHVTLRISGKPVLHGNVKWIETWQVSVRLAVQPHHMGFSRQLASFHRYQDLVHAHVSILRPRRIPQALKFCFRCKPSTGKQLLESFSLTSKAVACCAQVLFAMFSPPDAELEKRFLSSVCTSDTGLLKRQYA